MRFSRSTRSHLTAAARALSRWSVRVWVYPVGCIAWISSASLGTDAAASHAQDVLAMHTPFCHSKAGNGFQAAIVRNPTVASGRLSFRSVQRCYRRRSHKRCVARQGPRGTHPSRAGGCAHNRSRPWTLPSVLVAWLPGPLKGSCRITNHDPATGHDERPRVLPDGCAGRGRNPPFACTRPVGNSHCMFKARERLYG
jgi:hypothetical protein